MTGYTVLCYSKTNVAKKLPWKLALLSPKIKDYSLIVVQDTQIERDALSNCYRPNVYNRICRCKVNIQKNTPVTFRLTTSSEDTRIRLVCSKEDKPIAKITGKGNVILPILFLGFNTMNEGDQSMQSKLSLTSKNRRRSKSRSSSLGTGDYNAIAKRKDYKSDRTSTTGSARSSKMGSSSSLRRTNKDSKMDLDTVYTVEGYVEYDSWPLMKEEWEVVEKFKEKGLLRYESASLASNLQSLLNVK